MTVALVFVVAASATALPCGCWTWDHPDPRVDLYFVYWNDGDPDPRTWDRRNRLSTEENRMSAILLDSAAPPLPVGVVRFYQVTAFCRFEGDGCGGESGPLIGRVRVRQPVTPGEPE